MGIDKATPSMRETNQTSGSAQNVWSNLPDRGPPQWRADSILDGRKTVNDYGNSEELQLAILLMNRFKASPSDLPLTSMVHPGVTPMVQLSL